MKGFVNSNGEPLTIKERLVKGFLVGGFFALIFLMGASLGLVGYLLSVIVSFMFIEVSGRDFSYKTCNICLTLPFIPILNLAIILYIISIDILKIDELENFKIPENI